MISITFKHGETVVGACKFVLSSIQYHIIEIPFSIWLVKGDTMLVIYHWFFRPCDPAIGEISIEMKFQRIGRNEIFGEKGNDIAFMQFGPVCRKMDQPDWNRITILVPEAKRCDICIPGYTIPGQFSENGGSVWKTVEN